MNSKPEKLGRSTRSGKIVGTLVIATCLFLGAVWLLGNLLIARYPSAATNIASVTQTSFESSGDKDTTNEVAVETSTGSSHASDETPTTDGGQQSVSFEALRAIRASRSAGLRQSSPKDHDQAEQTDDVSPNAGGLQSSLDSMETKSSSRWDDVAAAETVTTPNSNTDNTGNFDSGWESTDSDSSVELDSNLDLGSNLESDLDLEPDSFEDPLDISFDNPVASNTTEAADLDGTFEPSELPKIDETQSNKPLDLIVDTVATAPVIAEDPNPTSSATGELGSRNRAVLRPAGASSSITDTRTRKALKPLRAKTPVGKTYPVRTWTSSDKRQVDAHFVSVDEKSVILSVRGKLYRVPLARLSKKDSDYLETIQDPALSK